MLAARPSSYAEEVRNPVRYAAEVDSGRDQMVKAIVAVIIVGGEFNEAAFQPSWQIVILK